MDRHDSLAQFIRDACRRRGVSLGVASRDLGKSRNWLERIVNYDPKTGSGIRRPKVEACKAIARYFNEDPNYILQLAGYISPPPLSTPITEEIVGIVHLLPRDDQQALLEYARLLKFRITATDKQPNFPDVPDIHWDELEPAFAQNLAMFVQDEPGTIPIWVEALNSLPEKAVELLLVNAQNQVFLRNELEAEKAAKILTRLARTL